MRLGSGFWLGEKGKKKGSGENAAPKRMQISLEPSRQIKAKNDCHVPALETKIVIFNPDALPTSQPLRASVEASFPLAPPKKPSSPSSPRCHQKKSPTDTKMAVPQVDPASSRPPGPQSMCRPKTVKMCWSSRGHKLLPSFRLEEFQTHGFPSCDQGRYTCPTPAAVRV